MKKTLATLLATAFLCLAWTHGFLNFVSEVEALQEPATTLTDVQKVDAIVVLTGGSKRLDTGIKLLANGSASKLFISGAYIKFPIESIKEIQSLPEDLRSCCISLGFKAESTIGNAQETKEWMSEQGFKSMRLVTANYHMPRSLALFHSAMPDVQIIPHPVVPENVKILDLVNHPGTAQFLAIEYCKYLLAKLKIKME